jgi:hypothetical protein
MATSQSRNLGFPQSVKLGTFQHPGGGNDYQFNFAQVPSTITGGGPYNILQLRLKFSTGGLQFTVPAGKIATARTFWSCLKKCSFQLGKNTPQGAWGGIAAPESLWQNIPGNLLGDFLTMHSRRPTIMVDGDWLRRDVMVSSGVASATNSLATHSRFAREGFSYQHGPYADGGGAGQLFGANSRVQFCFPIGYRSNGHVREDAEDCAMPGSWLHGLPVRGSGVKMDAANLQLLFNTVTEGGAAVQWTTASTVEVWADILCGYDDREGCPVLPCLRWDQPSLQTSEVPFAPALHFFSGFGAPDQFVTGNCDANYNVLAQTFATMNMRLGQRSTNYQTLDEYMEALASWDGLTDNGPFSLYTFGTPDAPIQPSEMAVVRDRMGIVPVAVPLPTLIEMGSDAAGDFNATFQNAVPQNPWRLQSCYPLYTPDGTNKAIAASGIPNVKAYPAVSSSNPAAEALPYIPRMLRV